MNRRTVPIAVGIAMLVGIVAWRVSVFSSALAAESAAQARMKSVHADIGELVDLRRRQPTTGVGGRPSDDVMFVAQRACADAAINPSLLREVTPDAERVVSPGLIQQSARVQIDGLTLSEMAAVARQWAQSQQVWTIQRIELAAGGPDRRQSGVYRVQLQVSALYVQNTPAQGR